MIFTPPPLQLLPKDGEALFYEGLFTTAEGDAFLAELACGVAWRQEPIMLFGKWRLQPRLTAWYGEQDRTYSYSGVKMQPAPWTEALLHIKQRLELVVPVQFTSVLLNLYRDQRDSMGWHRDDERELGTDPVIASVSFGASRTFKMRHRFDPGLKAEVDLSHGSLLVMQGPMQHFWEHSLPKRSRPLGPRLNLTFRVVR